ncbi:helix-turn-helix domain-containing protein [Hymenobacter armeniacus]|uniref:Helix-turn-helix domain-containing protein n=1 Tax=Hymenobacter armeniacus TaxID=2771358 RepID=A0ABR8JV72_9BACT|nr:helix-turn-helix domain-containing protein [Hymenobacter armeniacus]MBD2723743.1 helix-turn-helix domain-containing protein [Hymenobacter armeniacus]
MSVEELGNSLAARRAELGITQQRVADLGGISARQLIDWENGRGNPGFKQLGAVLAVLGLQLTIIKPHQL